MKHLAVLSIFTILFQFNASVLAEEVLLSWTSEIVIGDYDPNVTLNLECDPTYFICSTFNLDNFPPVIPYYQKNIFVFAPNYVGLSALYALEDTAKRVISNELGVKIDPVFLDAARGQVKALVYISLLNIINTPAADRTANEQGVYDYFQN